MSITLAALRQRMSQLMGDYISGTTTATGSGTTAVDSGLAALTLTNDVFKGWWILLTSGTYSGQERLVSSFTQSSGTITWGTTLGGNSGNGVTYEIHRWRPSLKKNYINYAMHAAFPFFNKKWDDRTLVSGNWLLNSNFELWASATIPDSWAKAGSPTVASQSATANKVRNGDYSCSFLTADYANDYIYQSEVENPALRDLQDVDVNVYGYARTSTGANGLYIAIVSYDDAGTTTTSTSSTTSLTTDWIKIEAENLAVPENASRVQVCIRLTGNGTVYLDNFILAGKTKYEYKLPTGLINVSSVWLGNDWNEVGFYDQKKLLGYSTYDTGGVYYLRFSNAPLEQYKLRIQGIGYETDLSADSDSWQLDDKRADIVASKAAGLHFEALAASSPPREADRYLAEAARRERQFQIDIRRSQMNTAPYQTDTGVS